MPVSKWEMAEGWRPARSTNTDGHEVLPVAGAAQEDRDDLPGQGLGMALTRAPQACPTRGAPADSFGRRVVGAFEQACQETGKSSHRSSREPPWQMNHQNQVMNQVVAVPAESRQAVSGCLLLGRVGPVVCLGGLVVAAALTGVARPLEAFGAGALRGGVAMVAALVGPRPVSGCGTRTWPRKRGCSPAGRGPPRGREQSARRTGRGFGSG